MISQYIDINKLSQYIENYKKITIELKALCLNDKTPTVFLRSHAMVCKSCRKGLNFSKEIRI